MCVRVTHTYTYMPLPYTQFGGCEVQDWTCLHPQTYIHTHTHTYTRTCMLTAYTHHTQIHTHRRTHNLTATHTNIHTYIHTHRLTAFTHSFCVVRDLIVSACDKNPLPCSSRMRANVPVTTATKRPRSRNEFMACDWCIIYIYIHIHMTRMYLL